MMQQKMVLEKYPVFTLKILFGETSFSDVDGVLADLKAKIDADEIATFIATFDHYAHTKSLDIGVINEEIKDAKNIVFCFGEKLPNPLMLGVRPRSIGVAKMQDSFIVSFLEAPNPAAQEKMLAWVESLKN